MANGSAYDFSEAFGRLTAVLEDSTELAVEGQSAKLDLSARRRLVGELELGLNEAAHVLEEMKTAL